MNAYQLKWGNHCLQLGARTLVMGIINVTPDSFSDGGKFFKPEQAVEQGLRLAEAGADILDVGGESTRPFAEHVSAEEESQRVLPVIKSLSEKASIPISIDTTKAEVARLAVDAGAAIINDISALRFDEEMADVAAKYEVPVILMHMLGIPRNMQLKPEYDDVVEDIRKFLNDAVDRALAKGIARSKIMIDPGIGFGKTVTHNLQIIKHLDMFMDMGLPVVLGHSRKSFIQNILRNSGMEEIKPDAKTVETGTQAVVAAAALKGVHVVRVHDVAETVVTLKLINAISNPQSAG